MYVFAGMSENVAMHVVVNLRRHLAVIAFAGIASLVRVASAEESTVSSKTHEAVHAAGDAAHEAGESAKHAGRELGKSAGDAGRKAADAAKHAGKDIAEGARHAGAEVKKAADKGVKAVKGDTESGR